MSQTTRGAANRPLSPHMQVWRWHITMFSSILHRACLIGLYAGLLILVGWALALAGGRGAYEAYMGLLGSPIGRLVMFGFTLALLYNVANSVRHLFWDTGRGFSPATSNLTSWAGIAFSVVGSVLIWALAAATGAF
jgi:succinate dehydrogenase / fumarate reductase cytochrome b subunit